MFIDNNYVNLNLLVKKKIDRMFKILEGFNKK